MSSREHKAVIRRFVDAVNSRHFDLFHQVFAPDATITFSGATMACDPQAAREIASGWLSVFPDWHLDLVDVVAEDDQVFARVPWTGTQHGAFLDLPPTGKTVHVDEMILFRFDGTLVVEAWEVWDEATMRRQLTEAES